MNFTWDETKNGQNVTKHGIVFEDVPALFDYPMVTFLDQRKEYGEDRWIGIGWLGDILAVVVLRNPKLTPSESYRHERQTVMNKISTQKKSGTDWTRLRNMKDEEIDFSDSPPIDRVMFKKMVIRMPQKKAALSLRLDPVVIEWFKAQGPRYQTRINAVLQSYVRAHSH